MSADHQNDRKLGDTAGSKHARDASPVRQAKRAFKMSSLMADPDRRSRIADKLAALPENQYKTPHLNDSVEWAVSSSGALQLFTKTTTDDVDPRPARIVSPSISGTVFWPTNNADTIKITTSVRENKADVLAALASEDAYVSARPSVQFMADITIIFGDMLKKALSSKSILKKMGGKSKVTADTPCSYQLKDRDDDVTFNIHMYLAVYQPKGGDPIVVRDPVTSVSDIPTSSWTDTVHGVFRDWADKNPEGRLFNNVISTPDGFTSPVDLLNETGISTPTSTFTTGTMKVSFNCSQYKYFALPNRISHQAFPFDTGVRVLTYQPRSTGNTHGDMSSATAAIFAEEVTGPADTSDAVLAEFADEV